MPRTKTPKPSVRQFQPLSIYPTPDVRDRAKAVADERGRPLTRQILRILEWGLAQVEKKVPGTEML